MADVRAEILAASRSRTGWLESNTQNDERKPFISALKLNFEEKQDIKDKSPSSSSKTETSRRLGPKVSSIANMFQSLSPQKKEQKPEISSAPTSAKAQKQLECEYTRLSENEASDSSHPSSVTSSPILYNSSHYTRFNSARAVFEQLVQNKKDDAQEDQRESWTTMSEGNTVAGIDPEYTQGSYSSETCIQQTETKHIVKKEEDDSSLPSGLLSSHFIPAPNEYENRTDWKDFNKGIQFDQHNEQNYLQSQIDEKSLECSLAALPIGESDNKLISDHSLQKSSTPNVRQSNKSSLITDVCKPALPKHEKLPLGFTSYFSDATNDGGIKWFNTAGLYGSLNCTEENANELKDQKSHSGIYNSNSTVLRTSKYEESHMKSRESLPYTASHDKEADPSGLPETTGHEDEKSDSGVSSAIIDSEYENDLLQVSEDSINSVSLDNTYTKSNLTQKDTSQTVTLQFPSSFSSGKGLVFTNPSDIIPTETDNIGGNYRKASQDDRYICNWNDPGNRHWKEGELSEPSTDHDSESGSPYETTNMLREAAGETLAEYEGRDNELFFVETVIGSDDHGNEPEPFPSPSVNRDVTNINFRTHDKSSKYLNMRQSGSDHSETSSSVSAPPSIHEDDDDRLTPCSTVLYDNVKYCILPDGHYYTEIPGLGDESEEDDVMYCPIPPRIKSKVKFSNNPIKVFSTYSIEDYDRRNEEVDPVAASAEYELEKRIEKMDVFHVDLLKGEDGLGLSIIGMGVGADAGLEKLGIFVKSVTENGAAQTDGRIRVNDQIIEVDGKSLVGVTQSYAASILRNTSGVVNFLIGRERDPTNSEIAQLISQSLKAEKEQRSQEPQEWETFVEEMNNSSSIEQRTEDPPLGIPDLVKDSSDYLSSENDTEILKIKLKEAQYRAAVSEAEIKKLREKLLGLEYLHSERKDYEHQLENVHVQLHEKNAHLAEMRKEIDWYQRITTEVRNQHSTLDRKYGKAKKVIKKFHEREKEYLHQEEYHIQQFQEMDEEYNALVTALKDRVNILEYKLIEAQKVAGLPAQLPSEALVNQLSSQIERSNKSRQLSVRKISIDLSDGELSDDISDISHEDSEQSRILNVEGTDSQIEGQRIVVGESPTAQNGNMIEETSPTADASCAKTSKVETNKETFPDKTDEKCETSPCRTNCNIYSSASEKSVTHREVITSCTSERYWQERSKNVSEHSEDQSSVTNASGSSTKNYQSAGKSLAHMQPRKLSFAEEIKIAVVEWQSKGQNDEQAALETREEHNDLRSSSVPVSTFISPEFSSSHSDSFQSQVATKNSDRSIRPTIPNVSHSQQDIKACISKKLPGPVEGTSYKEGFSRQLVPHPGLERNRKPHHWQGGPVHLWTATQVGQWLMAMGLEHYAPKFREANINGQLLLQLDSCRLKTLGMTNSHDRSLIKKKLKEIKSTLEKERRAYEKEQKAKEKLQKKAEKTQKKK